MPEGFITSEVDVAEIALYAFFLFFAGLVYYLRREDKREGFPMVEERRRGAKPQLVRGFPEIPSPKVFVNRDGTTYAAPPGVVDTRPVHGRHTEAWTGSPIEPTGNPMVDGIGPGAWALRAEEPDLTAEDKHRIVPIRVAPDHYVDPRDPNPVGMDVVGADRKVAGKVTELWIDRSEPGIRYLEMTAQNGRTVLVPMPFATVNGGRKRIEVSAILAHQFNDVPGLKHADSVTKREEDQICAYFAGGTLYATPTRKDPIL